MVTPETITGRLGNKMFQTAYLYAQMKNGVIPSIFVQDPKYFEKYTDDIKKMFGEGIGYLSQVGVHIRRGANPTNPTEPKYCENPFYVNLSETDYYERAMAMFPNEKFLVFSDDPEWCREKFKNNPDVQVMEKGDEVDDMNLLASCKGIIMANSSWSWWAAFLNPNEGKRIIAPKLWHSDGVERTKTPKSWERI